MTESDQSQEKQFQRKIYQELNNKLKSTNFKSGASEAHGLLTGLACRGIKSEQLRNKLHLFQLDNDDDLGLLQGLFELILRDLQSTTPVFNLLLPEDTSLVEKADEIASWCAGYMQGICHDGDYIFSDSSEPVQEMLQDILDIGGLQIDVSSDDLDEDERSVMEIEEYLRVGVQFIFDETVKPDQSSVVTPSDEIH